MNIQDTGIRGYLLWLKHDQPGIYREVAPQIAQYVPEAFSNREQSQAMGALMGLGSDTTGGAYGLTTFFGDDTGFNTTAVPGAGSSAADVATAADSGTSTPSITSTIASLVSAVGQVYLAKSQVDTLNQVNQIQLQRAQAGLAPLNTSSLGLGVPQVNVGVAPGTIKAGGIGLAVVVGLGLLWFLSGSRPAHSG